jgi:hypothetical protein
MACLPNSNQYLLRFSPELAGERGRALAELALFSPDCLHFRKLSV